MELGVFLLLTFTVGFLLLLASQNRPKTHGHLPPGPRPLPFLGNLLQMNRRGLLRSFMQVRHAQDLSPVGLACVDSWSSLSRKSKGLLADFRFNCESHWVKGSMQSCDDGAQIDRQVFLCWNCLEHCACSARGMKVLRYKRVVSLLGASLF